MVGILSTVGNPDITDETIRNYVAEAGGDLQNIYKAAQQYNISPEQLSGAMGGQQGYTVDAIRAYDAQAQGGATPAPTPTPTQAPDYGTLFGAGNPDITDETIRNYLNLPGMTSDQIMKAALEHGVSVDQISRAMAGNERFAPSTIQNYLESRNIFNPNQAAIDTANQRAAFEERYQLPTGPDMNLSAYGPTSAEAATAAIDPATGTVAGQLGRVLDPNSQIMQQARTFGAQQANQRGLLNTSLGVSAAQNEMIRAGLPIAQADAAAANQFALANLQNQQQAALFNADLARQYDLTKLGITKEMAINAENIARDYGLAQIDTESKIKIANIDAASKSSSDAAGLNDRLLAGINEINGRNISQQAKDDQIRTLVTATDGAIAMLGTFDAIGAELGPRPTGGTGASGTEGGGQTSTGTGSSNIATGGNNVTNTNGRNLPPAQVALIKQIQQTTGTQIDETRVASYSEVQEASENNTLNRYEPFYHPASGGATSGAAPIFYLIK